MADTIYSDDFLHILKEHQQKLDSLDIEKVYLLYKDSSNSSFDSLNIQEWELALHKYLSSTIFS